MDPTAARRALARVPQRHEPRALSIPAVRHANVPIEPATCGPKAFTLVLLAIVLQMTVSQNLLFIAGIPYDVPGGFPLFKLHAATYLTALAMLLALLTHAQPARQLAQIASTNRGLLASIAALLICLLSQIVCVGIPGAAITIESYISPWTLAVVLATCTPRQRAVIAALFISLIVLNGCLGITEAVLRAHSVQAYLNGRELKDLPGEFRPYALFDHPLTAAMATMMGVFVLLSTALRPALKGVIGTLMLIALLAWGGRMALAATCAILGGLAAAAIARAALTRTMSLKLAVATIATCVVGLTVLWFATTQTSIGERALSRLYFDDSAMSRTLQFRVLGLLDFDEAMIGVVNTRLAELAYGLSLKFPFEEIENPWLLAYLQLGSFGFLAFIIGLVSMIRHLWRAGAIYGKIIVVGLLLVASMSNSLGRKSNILFLLVAAVYATARAAPLPGDPHAG